MSEEAAERRAAPKHSHIPRGKETAPGGSAAAARRGGNISRNSPEEGRDARRVKSTGHSGSQSLEHETFKKQNFSFETLQRKKISKKSLLVFSRFTRVFMEQALASSDITAAAC